MTDEVMIMFACKTPIEHAANYLFSEAPLITIPGRMHPVEVRYCPTHESAKDKPTSAKLDPKPYLIIMQLIDNK